jgi:hypothetical protein
MAQYGRPISDVAVNSWTPTPLYEEINEVTPSDTDYITSPSGSPNYCEVALTNTLSDPLSSTGHILRVRARRESGGATGTAYLYDGSTQICSLTLTLGAGFTTVSHTLTSGEADSIGDYTDLRIRFYQDTNNKPISVSWAELEIPQASVQITPTVITGAGTVHAPTIKTGISTTRTVITGAGTIYAPTIKTGISTTRTVITGAGVINAPTIAVGYSYSATVITGQGVVHAPTVKTGVQINATVITARGQPHAPTVKYGVSFDATVIDSDGVVHAPTINITTTGVQIDATVITGAGSVHAPTIKYGVSYDSSVITGVGYPGC